MQTPETSEYESLSTAAHVWHVSPDALPLSDLQRPVLSWMTTEERARHERFRTDQLRHVNLITRWLCRSTLSKYTGVDPKDWTFSANPNGKPAIAGPVGFTDLRFNLTHTKGLVACIVSRAGEVGVDFEEMSRTADFDGITANFFSAAEHATLQSLPAERRAARFFDYWVVKESYLKGRGVGFSEPAEGFTVHWDGNGQPLPLGEWQLSLQRPTSQHVGATAIRPKAGDSQIPIIWRAVETSRTSTSSLHFQ